MSFLDNLENNLKALESAEQGTADAESQRRDRERERAAAQAVAPFAEELKKGPYTAELLTQAARVGHAMRVKVRIAWLGSTLRLEARDLRLELRPTPSAIQAVYFDGSAETRSEPLDLKTSPEDLLRRWLTPAA
jgi:hypothetical protein